MDLLIEAVVAFFLIVSGIFGLVGSYGLNKLTDTMQRLHAPTKATTLGVGGVLIASMIHFLLIGQEFTFHEVLITLFLFLTAPISANFIAKTYLMEKPQKSELPESGRECGWALYDDPPNARTEE